MPNLNVVRGKFAKLHKMGNFFLDIEGHVAGGQSPIEAIKSATSVASQSCWIDDSIGSIAVSYTHLTLPTKA